MTCWQILPACATQIQYNTNTNTASACVKPPYPDILDAAAFSGIAPVHVVHPLKIADINTNDDDQFAGIQIAGMMSLFNKMEGYSGKYYVLYITTTTTYKDF